MRQFFAAQVIGIAGAVAALVMPSHGFVNLGPGKLHAADDLMTDYCVIRHLAKLFGIERLRFAEQTAIDGDLANIVKIPGAAESGDFAGIHAHRFTDGGGVAAHAQ